MTERTNDGGAGKYHHQRNDWDKVCREAPRCKCGRLDMASYTSDGQPIKYVYWEDGAETVVSGDQCDLVAYQAQMYLPLIAQRDALVGALERAIIHIAAIGMPLNSSGEYDKNGEWSFDEALPNRADGVEIKAAFNLIESALASVKEQQ